MTDDAVTDATAYPTPPDAATETIEDTLYRVLNDAYDSGVEFGEVGDSNWVANPAADQVLAHLRNAPPTVPADQHDTELRRLTTELDNTRRYWLQAQALLRWLVALVDADPPARGTPYKTHRLGLLPWDDSTEYVICEIADDSELWRARSYLTELHFLADAQRGRQRPPVDVAELRLQAAEAQQSARDTERRRADLADLCELAWGVIANAHEGNWGSADDRWRDEYAVAAALLPPGERWDDGDDWPADTLDVLRWVARHVDQLTADPRRELAAAAGELRALADRLDP